MININSPYDSKVLLIDDVVKKIYARNTGIQFDLAIGENTIDFPIPYAWVKITGMEVINCEALDTVDLFIVHIASNIILNQFGFNVNLTKDYHSSKKKFDADLYNSLQIRIKYYSKTAKTIGINFIMDEVKE